MPSNAPAPGPRRRLASALAVVACLALATGGYEFATAAPAPAPHEGVLGAGRVTYTVHVLVGVAVILYAFGLLGVWEARRSAPPSV